RALTTATNSDSSPVFSTDGKSIAFLNGGDSKDIWYGTNNIALVPVAGGPSKILTTGLDRNVLRPQFAPDGSGVLFLLEDGGNTHLARVPVAGGAVSRILAGERDLAAFDVAKSGDIAILDTQVQQPAEIYYLKGAAGGAGAAAGARVSAVPPQLTHVND